jgi:hypothetical protein
VLKDLEEFQDYFHIPSAVSTHCIESAENSIILPMVLQIREIMVLQRGELEGKGSPPHF